MKFLHTCDLSLREAVDIQTLDYLLELAENHECRYLFVVGNLFANSQSAEALLDAARLSFDVFTGSTYVIAGDQDNAFLATRPLLGQKTHILQGAGAIRAILDGTSIYAVPYQEHLVWNQLADLPTEASDSIFFAPGSPLYAAFPVPEQIYQGIYRYAALGSGTQQWKQQTDHTWIVNPTSPRCLSEQHVGPRFVSIVDSNTWEVQFIELPFAWREEVQVTLSAFDKEANVIAKLQSIQRKSKALTKIQVQGHLPSYAPQDPSHWKAYLLRQLIDKQGFDPKQIELDMACQAFDPAMAAHPIVQSMQKQLPKNAHKAAELEALLLDRMRIMRSDVLHEPNTR